MIIEWNYSDNKDNDFVMPQVRAEVVLTHKDTGKVSTFDINGSYSKQVLTGLEEGYYTVYVRVYNWSTVKNTSVTVPFRYNRFTRTDGNVRSILINANQNIRYIAVSTIADIPAGTKVSGVLYYAEPGQNDVNYDAPIKFNIRRDIKYSELIKLPKYTDKVRVELFLENKSGLDTLTPYLDHIRVLAK